MYFLTFLGKWDIVIDVFVFIFFSLMISSFFYHYKRRAIPGKFWGGVFFSGIGSLIILGLFQNYIHKAVMWLMSPRIGEIQINLNLISIFLGGYLTLFIINKLNYNRERRG